MIALATSSKVEPASADAGSYPHHVGQIVTWRGASWVVTAIHAHPRLGRFLRLETGDGAYDLVHANGSDGAIEPLTWANVNGA